MYSWIHVLFIVANPAVIFNFNFFLSNIYSFKPQFNRFHGRSKCLHSSGSWDPFPNGEDIIWNRLRKDAAIEAGNEPLLASFMHAAILSHSSLEKSISFHMANQLESSAMISTQVLRSGKIFMNIERINLNLFFQQVQSLFLEAFEQSEEFRHV